MWHKSAPQAVRKATARDDLPRAWRAWVQHLSQRERPADPDAAISDGENALAWGMPGSLVRSLSQGIPAGQASDATAGIEQRILRWLGEASGGVVGVEYALEALALARRLPQIAQQVSAEAWFALLAHLIDTVHEAGAIDAEQQPLPAQLLAGELPLTLAYLFPELAPCRRLAPEARRLLSAGLCDLLDGEGLVSACHFALMRPLLACWTRCRLLGDAMKRPCFTSEARRQYAYMVRHALRFTRHDGTAMLGPAGQCGSGELLRAAVAAGGTAADRAVTARALPPAAQTAGRKAAALPEPTVQSDWAAAALLRPDWSRGSPRLAVLYPGQTMRVELACGKENVLAGPWSLEVTLDGRRLTPTSDWEQVCWVSDEDIDYLELEIGLDEGVRVQRQMALAREDRILFLADAVLGDRPGRLEYRAGLPLAPGMNFCPDKDGREGCLEGAKRRARVFPLALAEWRSLWASGELRAVSFEGKSGGDSPAAQPSAEFPDTARQLGDSSSHALELTHAVKAARLYAPLLFDLDRRRLARPFTWRRLTVAELLEVQPDDVAVGYRVAVGRRQWLIYRSLAPKGNRTLLGHNLSSEALLARFDPTGEVEALIEVE